MRIDPVLEELKSALKGLVFRDGEGNVDRGLSIHKHDKILSIFNSIDPDRWEILGRLHMGGDTHSMELVAVGIRDLETKKLMPGVEYRMYWGGQLHHAIPTQQLKLLHSFMEQTEAALENKYETTLEQVWDELRVGIHELNKAKKRITSKKKETQALITKATDDVFAAILEMGFYLEPDSTESRSIRACIADCVSSKESELPTYEHLVEYIDSRVPHLLY